MQNKESTTRIGVAYKRREQKKRKIRNKSKKEA